VRVTAIHTTRLNAKQLATTINHHVIQSDHLERIVELVLDRSASAREVFEAAQEFAADETAYHGAAGGATVKVALDDRGGRYIEVLSAASRRVLTVTPEGLTFDFGSEGSQHLAGAILAECYSEHLDPDIEVAGEPLECVKRYWAASRRDERLNILGDLLFDYAEDLEPAEHGIDQRPYTQRAIERALGRAERRER